MSLSPQRIRDTNFKAVRKGYDPAEVEAFVEEVAAALETAQNEATAMEAKARAAVARLQELSRQAGDAGAGESAAAGRSGARQRRRVRDHQPHPVARPAHGGHDGGRGAGRGRPPPDRRPATTRPGSLDQARGEAAAIVEAAKADARRAGESERVQVEGEVQALLARRDFLESDVDHLEQYLVAQRERIVEAVASLNDLVQRVPGGLADMRRPLLSAAAEPTVGTDAASTAGVDATVDAIDDAEVRRTSLRRGGGRRRRTTRTATTRTRSPRSPVSPRPTRTLRTPRRRTARCSTRTANRRSRSPRSTRATRLAADAGGPRPRRRNGRSRSPHPPIESPVRSHPGRSGRHGRDEEDDHHGTGEEGGRAGQEGGDEGRGEHHQVGHRWRPRPAAASVERQHRQARGDRRRASTTSRASPHHAARRRTASCTPRTST